MPPVEIPTPTLSGEFDAFVHDHNSNTPSNVIPREVEFHVDASWYLEGALAPILSGEWELRVALESIGGGVEITRPVPAVTRDYQADGVRTGTFPNERMSFSARVIFPANSVNLQGSPSRAFHATALLTHKYPGGTPGPFAAVYDLGLIQIYDSPALP